MPVDPAIATRRAFIERFTTLCADDERIVAAFLSGSYAAGTADKYSDVDLLLVAADDAYERLFEDRWKLLGKLGELVLAEDFDGFGRDMLLYLYRDGTDGEVDLHRRSTLSWVDPAALVTLVDKDGVAAQVNAWPTPPAASRERRVEWLMSRFWRHVWLGSAAIARGRLLTAFSYLDAARLCCVNLARLRHDLTAAWSLSGYDKAEGVLTPGERADLAPTFTPLDAAALATGLEHLADVYEPLARELSSRHDLDQPQRLAAVVRRRLEEVRGGVAPSEVETPLYGGLVDRVVRVGPTVRRPAGAWTPTIHALLDHLEAGGFPAPRARGLDASGREVLTYLDGEASLWPWPPVLRDTRGVRQVGRLVRSYHDAVADFRPPDPPIWQMGERELGPGEIVCHGDLDPSNLIWSGDELVGLIDWELARPGRPLDDLAMAAWAIVPLCPDKATADMGFETPPDRRARLAALASAYGSVDPDSLIAEIVRLQDEERERMQRLGASGREPWRTFVARGLDAETSRDQQWLAQHARALT